MKKTLLALFVSLCLAPLPSLADDIAVHPGDSLSLYVSNNQALIRLTADGSAIQGSTWSTTTDRWSSPTTLFTNTGEAFTLEPGDFAGIKELANDTIILSQGDDLISYSTEHGFQHFTQPSKVYDVVTTHNTATLIEYCQVGETRSAALWTETAGVGGSTTLNGSNCTEDLSYFTGQKDILIDFYSGVAYDTTNQYAVIDTLDLSDVNYVGQSYDFDPQGNNPDLALRKNGDMVFAYENNLFGFSYADRVWSPLVKLADDFTVIGGDNFSEFDYSPLQTEDRKQILAFSTNEANTDYHIYQWTSAAGWQLDKTYTFTEAAALIPTTNDKSLHSLDWGFWFDQSNTIKVYRWNTDQGYAARVTRTLDCVGPCVLTLDISKKNKIFLAWGSGTEESGTYAAAWRPGTGTWQDTTLDTTGNYTLTHITDAGRWLVQYQKTNNNFSAQRWTPDHGWQEAQAVDAAGIYYNGEKMYTTELGANHDLTIYHYSWKEATSLPLATIEAVEEMDRSSSFIFDQRLFVFYLTLDGLDHVTPIEL